MIIKMLSIEGMFLFLMQLLLLTLPGISEFYWDRVCSLCLGALALLPHLPPSADQVLPSPGRCPVLSALLILPPSVSPSFSPFLPPSLPGQSEGPLPCSGTCLSHPCPSSDGAIPETVASFYLMCHLGLSINSGLDTGFPGPAAWA